MKKDLIKNYEYAVNQILYFFIKKYFGNIEEQETYWIGTHIGGVACINGDYFFNPEEMLEYLKNSASRKQMFDYYDYALNEEEQDRTPLSFKHYKLNLKHK